MLSKPAEAIVAELLNHERKLFAGGERPYTTNSEIIKYWQGISHFPGGQEGLFNAIKELYDTGFIELENDIKNYDDPFSVRLKYAPELASLLSKDSVIYQYNQFNTPPSPRFFRPPREPRPSKKNHRAKSSRLDPEVTPYSRRKAVESRIKRDRGSRATS